MPGGGGGGGGLDATDFCKPSREKAGFPSPLPSFGDSDLPREEGENRRNLVVRSHIRAEGRKTAGEAEGLSCSLFFFFFLAGTREGEEKIGVKMKPDRGKWISEKQFPFWCFIVGQVALWCTAVLLGNGWVEVLSLKRNKRGEEFGKDQEGLKPGTDN